MKNLRCPQCDIQRFYVKNEQLECLVVTVNNLYEVITVHSTDLLDGFDLTMLYCLGCSWKGSPKSLKGGNHKKHYS
jgi:hypothetical protein